jgi:hypothetical protein
MKKATQITLITAALIIWGVPKLFSTSYSQNNLMFIAFFILLIGFMLYEFIMRMKERSISKKKGNYSQTIVQEVSFYSYFLVFLFLIYILLYYLI